MIKYESNEYWQNLELSKDFSKILLITNKSMKQIENYKILIDILYTNDDKLVTKFDFFFNSVNEILKETKLISSERINFKYSTLFDSKDLRFKYHRFVLNSLDYIDKFDLNAYRLFQIIHNQSNCSEDFCIAFHEVKSASSRNGIEIIFSLIEKKYGLQNLLGALHNICKLNLNYNEIWQDKLKIIQSLAIKYEQISELKFVCYLIISLLAKDDEMKQISVENTQIILTIVNQVKIITDRILDKNYKRNKIEINKELIEVASNANGWYLIEVHSFYFYFLSAFYIYR